MFCLIPNELQITYQAIFEKLHIIYKFNSFIITLYFATAISNAITKEFPETIKIKCFFHFLQSLVRKFKKLGLYTEENIKKIMKYYLILLY